MQHPTTATTFEQEIAASTGIVASRSHGFEAAMPATATTNNLTKVAEVEGSLKQVQQAVQAYQVARTTFINALSVRTCGAGFHGDSGDPCTTPWVCMRPGSSACMSTWLLLHVREHLVTWQHTPGAQHHANTLKLCLIAKPCQPCSHACMHIHAHASPPLHPYRAS